MDVEKGYGYEEQGEVPYAATFTAQTDVGPLLGSSVADVEAHVRQGFARKVFGILTMQLIVTFGVVAPFLWVASLQSYVQANRWVYWTSFAVLIVLLIALACCKGTARKFPNNMLLLSLFTIVEGVVLGVICSYYTAESVLIAVGETVAVAVALTVFACQTRYDFTGKGGYLIAALVSLLMFGIIAGLFAARNLEVVNVVYASIGTLIFSLYIVYDVQLIIGGKHKRFQFSVDDYVFAALSLYLDIINLFLMILSLGGNRR